MEHVSNGLKKVMGLVTKKPRDMLGFVIIVMIVAFLGFLPVLLLNKSWMDSSQFIKTFYDAARNSVAGGTDVLASLNPSNLGAAGYWVFASSLWRYLILIPLEIALLLPMLKHEKTTNILKNLRFFPAVVATQVISGFIIIATALIGILVTIALVAGAAAPFFMIIVLLAVLSLVVVLIMAPFGFVLDGMPLFKSIGFSFNNSLRHGMVIFLTLIVPSVIVSTVNSWIGNIGLVSDLISLAFFVPQYCILHSVYERMIQDVAKNPANI